MDFGFVDNLSENSTVKSTRRKVPLSFDDLPPRAKARAL
jgi:hypothetical protein